MTVTCRACFAAFIIAAMSAAARAEGPSPYDVIEHNFGSYVDRNDPLALPLKIKSLAADPYKFWRGSKDLFFAWAKTDARDWLDDHSNYVSSHGDLHLGNIGTYTTDAHFRSLAFGMVDFDDSTDLPFELELLQGLITLRLVADQRSIAPDPSGDPAETLLNAYQDALVAGKTATELLANDDKVIAMLRETWGRGYDDELLAFAKDGAFRKSILAPNDAVREILRPAKDRAPAIAEGIAAAIARDPKLAGRIRLGSAKDVLAAVKDVAQRTRVGSSGSQGLKKYLVLLSHPLVGEHHDVMIYLKQQIPAAAERAGAVPRDARPPGQRCSEEMAALTDPPAWFNGWCQVGDESYWVTVKEPWSDELDAGDVKDASTLLWAARAWGTVAGSAHGRGGRGAAIRQKLTPQVRQVLTARTATYVARLRSDFAQFRNDPRVAADIARADAAIDAVASAARRER
jgi:uncharacterized protein (DUF2252 family)